MRRGGRELKFAAGSTDEEREEKAVGGVSPDGTGDVSEGEAVGDEAGEDDVGDAEQVDECGQEEEVACWRELGRFFVGICRVVIFDYDIVLSFVKPGRSLQRFVWTLSGRKYTRRRISTSAPALVPGCVQKE